MVWWVAYRRGSFLLKERYSCIHRAHERCMHLLADAQHLRIVRGDDIDGLASLIHVLELPAMTSEC